MSVHHQEPQQYDPMAVSGRGQHSLKRPWEPWLAAGIVSFLLLIAAVTVPLYMLSWDIPSGALSDGTEWGPSLGAEAARSDGIGGAAIHMSADRKLLYLATTDGINVLLAEDLSEHLR